ncbi:hypothetical protein F3Y22_tig00110528pilonHSYRG00198 [Hibiscus syriacus]|uniref:Pentatricopeptide repeat-containing protein n=1 Tax=Hibiscus syriacus TaxID=106335 RepID=A0A6A3AC18_HIBSY|nr:hypothetical protein F3Y22_tig00110528pilonHSYRG00198 [Hibiscus syriacus]
MVREINTYSTKINGVANLESIIQKCAFFSHIKQLQAYIFTTGNFKFSLARSKLLDLCAIAPFGSLSFAVSVFRRIPTPFTNDFNAIIRGLIQSPQPSAAFAWFRAMQRGSFRVDASLALSLSKLAHVSWLLRSLSASCQHNRLWVHGGRFVRNYFAQCVSQSRQSWVC